jgi:hypothetical protein
MLNVPAGVAHQRIALTPQRAHATHLRRRAKRAAQQPDGVQVLQPPAVHHVGLAPGHVLHVARIDQAHFDARLLEQLGQWDPIYTGGLHRHGLDPERLQPRDQRAEIFGESGKTTHGFGGKRGGHRDVDLAGPDVGAGGVRIDDRLDRLDFGLALARHGRAELWRRPQAAPCAQTRVGTLSNGMRALTGCSPLKSASARAPR